MRSRFKIRQNDWNIDPLTLLQSDPLDSIICSYLVFKANVWRGKNVSTEALRLVEDGQYDNEPAKSCREVNQRDIWQECD
jgi:hypothetical protein